MDLRKLKTILELFEESKQVVELEIKEGEDRVKLSKAAIPVAQVAPAPSSVPVAPPAAPVVIETVTESDNHKGEKVTSPMVGTFYRSASPESIPFARAGQTVEVGQTLCIIEAMKLMNEIPSPVTGKITSILVENGSAVGFGDILFIIE